MRQPCFSETNDPLPDGVKPTWISARTGEIIEPSGTIIPAGFNRWVRDKKATRAVVMLVFCAIGQPRFKAKMKWVACKCDMKVRCLQLCLNELQAGEWIKVKHCRRGGTLWGWNIFTIPHLYPKTKPPAGNAHSRAHMEGCGDAETPPLWPGYDDCD